MGEAQMRSCLRRRCQNFINVEWGLFCSEQCGRLYARKLELGAAHRPSQREMELTNTEEMFIYNSPYRDCNGKLKAEYVFA